ncbi:MAG: hypothetical protein RLZ37_1927 [Actinomycetota bacterium]|jgi:hypothetical protein
MVRNVVRNPDSGLTGTSSTTDRQASPPEIRVEAGFNWPALARHTPPGCLTIKRHVST